MSAMVRRDPFGLASVREAMDRLFDDSFFPTRSLFRDVEEGTLPVDISRDGDEIRVRASLPGFQKQDIDVQVHDGVLAIEATHEEREEEQREHYYRRERRVGSVSRRIALPGVVSDADVAAELRDGVLTVRINVPEQQKPKRVEIAG